MRTILLSLAIRKPFLRFHELRHWFRNPDYSAVKTKKFINAKKCHPWGNPIPVLNQPLVPTSISGGSNGLMPNRGGTGFVSGATIDFNTIPQPIFLQSGAGSYPAGAVDLRNHEFGPSHCDVYDIDNRGY